jgi:hypothetical protein
MGPIDFLMVNSINEKAYLNNDVESILCDASSKILVASALKERTNLRVNKWILDHQSVVEPNSWLDASSGITNKKSLLLWRHAGNRRTALPDSIEETPVEDRQSLQAIVKTPHLFPHGSGSGEVRKETSNGIGGAQRGFGRDPI